MPLRKGGRPDQSRAPAGEGQGHRGQQIWMAQEKCDDIVSGEATEEGMSGKTEELGGQLNRGLGLDLALDRSHFSTTKRCWGIFWNLPLGVTAGYLSSR